MNAVIYARFSSHNQTEQSIEGQLKTCYEFAQKNGYTIVGEYIDRAISGTTDARPDFLRMIEDSAKKGFQYVLVYQLDRFARNRYDSATYKAKLKKNGVRVLSARENITDDASGILVEGLLESMAEYYSAELAQKIRRGMAINAEKCLANGSNPGLGFKVAPDKHYIIDEETAPIVVRIFEEYAAGKTVTEICESLNNQGVRTSRGAMFNKNSLRKMLQNKRYIGYYLYKDIETPGGMPRIISDDLFYKVQEIMTKNRKAPARTKAKQEYLLTTKLFCGKCRDMMTGVKGTSHTGAAYYYYKCNNAKKKQCDKKAVQKDYIEDLVIAECRKQLTPANIDKIAHEVVALCEREKDNTNLRRIEKLMRENERKQRNLMSAVAECDIDSVRKSLYVEIARLTTELDTLKNEYAIEQAGAVSLTITEVKFFLTQLRKGRADDISYRKTLINVFVNAIYLYDDKLVIFFNSGDKPVTIDDELLDQIENSAGFVFGALGSTIPDHHLMKVKWWFFFYRTATVTHTDIYHIKDLEDYGNIVLKNIYPFHKRGKQLLVLLNGFTLTNVGTNSGKCFPHTCFININSLCLLLSLNLNLFRQFGLVFLEYRKFCHQFFCIKTTLDCLDDVGNLSVHLVVLGFQKLQFSASFVLFLGISP